MSESPPIYSMTYNEFCDICAKEYENGFGEVDELHIDQKSWKVLWNSMNIRSGDANLSYRHVLHITNPITGTPVKLFVHENHVMVTRCPQPVGTRHRVLLEES